ncbi:dynein axonemal intermediate chain 4-like isoform X2 [Rhopilema esculentum]|uniref:dynein axonemal intermediate chain 4-like isoform X2 n=1 Tax=Rhopilema esculentum TaxID=499914 RepID=UPI0031D41932
MKKNLGKSTLSGKRSVGNVSMAGSQASYGTQTKIGFRASKSTMYGTGSRRNVAIDERSQKSTAQKAAVQVYDELGQDVTPRSLLPADVHSQRKNQSSNMILADSSSVGTPSELAQSIYGTSMQTSYAQGFTRSMMGSMIGGSSRISLDSITDEITEPSHTHDFSTGLTDIQTRRAFVKEDLSEADLDRMVNVKLSETDTIWHLDMPGISVSKDSDIAEEVRMRNKKYEELLKNRAGNDMYVERGMQTYNNAPKQKEVQTVYVGKQDFGCMATNWDLYDTFAKTDPKKDDAKGDGFIESLSRPSSREGNQETEALPNVVDGGDVALTNLQKSTSVQSLMTESRASFMTTSNTSDVGDLQERESLSQANIDMQAEKILKSESMKKNLFVVERAVVQNIFHAKQASYKGLVAVTDSSKEPSEEKEAIETKIGPNLTRLWAYSCNITKGKKVNCMAWNKANQDLLAVGYGNFGSDSNEEGLICCWSLKNPEFPERLYHLPSAVTALDFSSAFPNLLAVGLRDGTIAIYNVRHTTDSAVLDSSESHGKQSGPIWQLRWIDRNKGTGEDKGGEVLVSGSADGRITQWSIRKGFEFQDLMKLKKMNVAKQAGKSPTKGDGKKGDALISRYVAAMCFDFHPDDGNLYIAGSEEGNIYKCSCSYNEQFLETYTGHTGPVYKVVWCPFLSDAFISCSADWSIRIWHQDKQSPVLTLQSAQATVSDIDWSPRSPTVIGAVNDTQVEIWDLAYSTLDPLIVNVSIDKNLQLTSIIFAIDTEAVLIGDSEGQVTVYQLRSMPSISPHQVGILSKMIHTVDANHLIDEEDNYENDNEAPLSR